jgi:hypothetical protein
MFVYEAVTGHHMLQRNGWVACYRHDCRAGSIRAYGMVVNGLSLMADRPIAISISGPTPQFGSIGKRSCIEGVVREEPPAAADNGR